MTDYTALITSEHEGQPNFTAMVSAVTNDIGVITNFINNMPMQFDLNAAVGAQLDQIGLWVGLSRKINIPLAVYFSFDTVGLGFDQGSWQGPYDPSQGLTSLDDATYRVLLIAKIGANTWNGSTSSLNAIYAQAFAGTGANVWANDNQNMTMDVYISGASLVPVMAGVLRNGILPLKPAGVHINGYTVNSTPNTPLFGFDVENQYVSGFDVGSFGVAL